MNWPLIIGVAWIAVGGALTLAGVRIAASQLSIRVGARAERPQSSRLLVQGIVMLVVGGLMLLYAETFLDRILPPRGW